MPRPILYDYAKSSAAYRVRIALNLLGVEYDSVDVDLLAGAQTEPAYRALNPLGLVPMLDIDGRKLTQSLSIIMYLAARFPNPPLLPGDPADAAHVRSMALTIACEIHPLNNLRVRKYLADELDADKDAVSRWISHWMEQGFAALEAAAAPRSGDFLFGDTPTVADICLVPQLYNARRFNVALAPYPTLLRADENANKLEAFAAAHPDKQ